MEANLVVDFNNMRCGNCKVLVRDKLSKACSFCGATFSHVSSNHVGLASKLEAERSRESNGSTITEDVTVEPEDKWPEMVSG